MLANEDVMGSESFFAEARENSQVKTEIISKYFWAWAKIISSRSARLAYIDLFAGPGRYADGTKSTPLLVLEQAIAEPKFRDKLVTVFNEGDTKHSESLAKAIKELPGLEKLKYQPAVDNEIVGDEITKRLASINLVPSLCFIDPFGYKGLSLKLINAVVKDWACECLFFFNYNRINMGIGNEFVREHIDALFGVERAAALRNKLKNLSAADRELHIVEEIVEALKEMGGRYVLPFRFRTPKGERTSHHLIFVSKHPLGYGIMKGIMAGSSSKRDQGVASFEYNAADERYPSLFELTRPLDDLEGMLLETFAGKQLSALEVFERHNVGRPYILANYKDALRNLEKKRAITVDPPADKRRKNKGVVTFADATRVSFPRR